MDTRRRSGDHVLVQRVHEGPNLVHLPPRARRFLATIDSPLVPDAILVAVTLLSDAFRYGAPPVTLEIACHVDHLRVEVTDNRPFSPNSRPHARLLDRLTTRRGVEAVSTGGTRAWAEITSPPLRNS